MGVRPGRGALRLARTLLVALPSTALSTAAHSAAGGCVSVVGVLVLGLSLGTATWTQLSRQRSGRFLLGWLAVGQLLGHGLLEYTCRGTAHHATGSAMPMLVLHGGAVLVAALVLACGEHRLWAFARLLSSLHARVGQLSARALGLPNPVVPSWRRPPAPAPTAVPWPTSTWCSLRPVRRGPPCRALSRI
jgi:hypothetical protein